MDENWIIISIVGVLGLILVYFLIKRNLKDEKEYEEYLSDNESTNYIEEESEQNDI